MTVVTVATRRMAPAALSPAVKSLNYLQQHHGQVRSSANLAKADEGPDAERRGLRVAECTGRQHVFIVKRGIFTPPIYAEPLRGITWQAVLDIAADMGLNTNVQSLTRYDPLHGRRGLPHRHGR